MLCMGDRCRCCRRKALAWPLRCQALKPAKSCQISGDWGWVGEPIVVYPTFGARSGYISESTREPVRSTSGIAAIMTQIADTIQYAHSPSQKHLDLVQGALNEMDQEFRGIPIGCSHVALSMSPACEALALQYYHDYFKQVTRTPKT